MSAGKSEGGQEEQGKNETSSTAGIQNDGTAGNSETTIDADEAKESEQLSGALRNAGESADETPAEANAGDEAADTSDKYKLVTDEEGLAKATHLPKGRAYTLRETLPRFDLGYVTSDWSKTRFLASDGRWYESEDTWIEARNAECEGGCEGDVLWKETIENDFTRLAFFKVDAERYEQAGKTHADDGSAEQAASQARIEGGRFRLEDSQGNPIEPCNDGLKAEGWAAQGKTPVEFNHLRVGETYVLTEACAPEGYKTENQELRIEIRDTPEIEIVTLKKRANQGSPENARFRNESYHRSSGTRFRRKRSGDGRIQQTSMRNGSCTQGRRAPLTDAALISPSTKSPRAAGLLAFSKNELFQSSLRDLDQRSKSLGVVDGHVGEHLRSSSTPALWRPFMNTE